jgi:hypothetical protein
MSVTTSVRIDIADPRTWPMRMKVLEVCAVLRISRSELYRRIDSGRFPKADGGTWSRDFVENYVRGGIKQFERNAEQRARREQISVVGGRK